MKENLKNKKPIGKAKVVTNNEWLKANCLLFYGSEVEILKQRGDCYDCVTNAGVEVTLKANEIRIKNQ